MLFYFRHCQLLAAELTYEVMPAAGAPQRHWSSAARFPNNPGVDSFFACSYDDVIDNAAQDLLSLLMRDRLMLPQVRHVAGDSAKLLQLLLRFILGRRQSFQSDLLLELRLFLNDRFKFFQ